MSSLINSLGNPIKQCMKPKESGQHMTLQELQMTIFDNLGIEDESILSAEDSHVKLFQLLGNEEVLTTLEGLYSLKSFRSEERRVGKECRAGRWRDYVRILKRRRVQL